MMLFVAYFSLLWISINICLLFVYKRDLLWLWQEPAFNKPIVIFESDDWGPGPLIQTDALKRLNECLSKVIDQRQRHPVMTLALTLSIADTKAMANSAGNEYQSLNFDDPQFNEILEAINDGVDKGVFSLQLHGKEHYWPENLIKSAKNNDVVTKWLTQEKLPNTEELPPHLQSRWINSTVLPSQALLRRDIVNAVVDEVELYRQVFGETPRIVVPPTFIWTNIVEQAWKVNGVKIIITPGCRIESRDKNGAPISESLKLLNNMQSETGIIYVVRDEYFEPTKGHTAGNAMGCIEKKTKQGRPILFETHRFNYVGEQQAASIAELEILLARIIRDYPHVWFMSTEDLADIMKTKKSEIVETKLMKRLRFLLARVNELRGFWRMAKLTGLALIINLVYRVI